jgi:hypothetical protein
MAGEWKVGKPSQLMIDRSPIQGARPVSRLGPCDRLLRHGGPFLKAAPRRLDTP